VAGRPGADVARSRGGDRAHAPPRPGRPPVHEIAHLYRDAFGAARRTIYCESQYLASAAIADVLAERLAELDGPEIVVVNPLEAEGWLEEEAMGSARALVVRRLREADRHGRFRIFHPVTTGGEPIYVHAKILVIDDRLLRVGSSNLNNRSLGFDTECDLAIQAPPGEAGAAMRAAIVAFRDGLVAEHLGMEPATVAAAVREHGSLARAVEALRRHDGKTLVPLEVEPPSEAERLLAGTRLFDPERPGQAEKRVTHLVKRLLLSPRRALADAPQAARDALATFRDRHGESGA
jgi:phospholipase D1/2